MPRCFQLVVEQMESAVANAQSNLKLEYGNQEIAKQEYKLLEDVISENDKDLVLRKPQLVSAQSALKAAEARLEEARLDLARTNIKAPFNAIVNEKFVDLGATVSPTTILVALTGTDEYWIEALIPVDKLKWIEIPRHNGERGSPVRIYDPSAWEDGVFREGVVLCLSSALETEGRMAKVLVSVKDPLSLSKERAGAEPLLIGSYVRVEVEGRKIPSVFRLARELLRNGDSVWLISANGTLKIQPVDIVFWEKEHVLIGNGISARDRIITTDLSAVVEGMPLRLRDDAVDSAGAEEPGGAGLNRGVE